MANGTEIDERLKPLLSNAAAVLQDTDVAWEKLTATSRSRAKQDKLLRSAVAVLSVASPTLVAYQHNLTSGNDWETLATIVLVAVAGAATTIQNIWALGKIASAAGLNAIQLHQIKGRLQLAMSAAQETTDKLRAYADLDKALKDAQSQYFDVMKAYHESEVASLTAP
jgi:hypothetical protein